ncbi:ATPase, T2SS/T4P/T4SS family [Microbacter sp. GSS18]|nr:ATPase, T2SS/T4P/T4SS family [Microbacter sp. GSS18]
MGGDCARARARAARRGRRRGARAPPGRARAVRIAAGRPRCLGRVRQRLTGPVRRSGTRRRAGARLERRRGGGARARGGAHRSRRASHRRRLARRRRALDGGLRVHAVLPPVAVDGTAISIRVPRRDQPTLVELEQRGMFPAAARRSLEAMVARRDNVLVTGPAGAGKTTLLAALLSAADERERIVTVEDVAELRLRHPHHIRLEARQPNLEGAGAVGLSRLVREALRMRPDRLVVGECRGAEIRDLLAALNTGHDGGAGTLHANGLADVPARLENLGALAGLDDRAVARQAASAIDLVVHVGRRHDGARSLVGVGRPAVSADGRLTIEEVPCAV